MRKKKKHTQNKWVRNGVAGLCILADSFRFPDRAVPRRLSLVYIRIMILTCWCKEIQSSPAAMDQLQHALKKSRTSATLSIKTMACYPGDCPVRPQSPGIPPYTCQPVTRWLPAADALPGPYGKGGVMRCHFVACTQQQLRFQLNPYHRSWPLCHGIRQ